MVLGYVLIVVACFLPWTHNPSYSLFTIGDYTGSYGQYVNELRYVSYGVFLVPLVTFGSCASLVNHRAARICAFITSIYVLIFSALAALAINRASESFSPLQSVGIYVSALGATVVLISAVRAKTSLQ